jgi:hypothetical protein
LFTPISLEWQFWQMRWKIALPAIGSPSASAALAHGTEATNPAKSNNRLIMYDVLYLNALSQVTPSFQPTLLAAGCVRKTELCGALTASVIKQALSAATQHNGFQLARVAASTIISSVRHTHTC